MNLVAKLALTVVMLAIGAAPALALHADTFLPGRGDASTREAPAPPPTSPAPPAAEPLQHGEGTPEGLVPVTGIPQTDADWNAWIADRTGQDEPAVDPVNAVEPPVDESAVDPFYGGFEDEPGSDDVEPEIAPEDEPEDERGLLGRLLG